MVKNIIILQDIQESEKKSSDLFLILFDPFSHLFLFGPLSQMSFDLLPSELVLLVITFLNTRDVVLLGRTCRLLHGIAEQERNKRQDIDRLLSRYVEDTQGFRALMRETGAIIVGDVARAFFTGDEPPKELDMAFGNSEYWYTNVKPWLSFFATKSSFAPCKLTSSSFIHLKVCFMTLLDPDPNLTQSFQRTPTDSVSNRVLVLTCGICTVISTSQRRLSTR
jgi:hypothetical protein